MKKIVPLLVLSIFSFFGFIHAQSWYWATGGSSSEIASPVATDKDGNAYVAGTFGDTITIGNTTLISGAQATYLVKYDSSGNVLWVVQSQSNLPSKNIDAAVSVDAMGDVFLLGDLSGGAIFGLDTLPGNSYYSYLTYLAKYSKTGNLEWVQENNGKTWNDLSYGNAVTSDKYGNVYVTGMFVDTVSFGSDTIRSLNYGLYLTKYDSSGNIVWVRHSPPINSYMYGNDVAVDDSGNVYVTGEFQYSFIKGTDTILYSPSSVISYLMKYSSSGNILWAKSITNNNGSANSTASAIAIDKVGNIYLTGYFIGGIGLDSISLYSDTTINYIYSIFLAKYDGNGNIKWAKQTNRGWRGPSIAADKIGHLYLTGSFDGITNTIIFDSLALSITPLGWFAGFIMELDTSGHATRGSLTMSLGLNNCGHNPRFMGVAADSSGRYIYLSSQIWDTVTLGADVFQADTNSQVTARWSPYTIPTAVELIYNSTSNLCIYPNPTNGIFTMHFAGAQNFESTNIEIYNVIGERVITEIRQLADDKVMDLSGQPSGIYFYRVVSENGGLLGEGKIIKD